MVDAVAGSGKTTTILAALDRVPKTKRVCLAAFNKTIATELKSRVERCDACGEGTLVVGAPCSECNGTGKSSARSHVTVSTLHALGLRAITDAFGRPLVDAQKGEKIARAICNPSNRAWARSVAKCVSLAKCYLADNVKSIEGVIDTHQLCPPEQEAERQSFVEQVLQCLKSAQEETGTIDFDDMVWFVGRLGIKVPQFDVLFVDETQDLNAAQIALVLRAVKAGGRVIAVGDPRQAIYAFRGAADGAFERVRAALDAKVLPLSVTYRCARSVVAEAAKYVPHLEAAPNAAEGSVEVVAWNEMVVQAKPGDFILSRTNAPLMGLCLGFLRDGRRAAIQGRDIGARLAGLVNRAKAADVTTMLRWVGKWADAEVARLTRAETDPAGIIDQRDCIEALSEGETAVAAVIAKIERLFADGDDRSRITLSTTHKAKGMERDRVFLLRATYFQRARTPQQAQEEANLYYVAVTRARVTLRLVEPRRRG